MASKNEMGTKSAVGPRLDNPLGCRGFRALLVAQSLGAFNDNLVKMVVSLLMVGAGMSLGASGGYLSMVGVVLVLPYLLFSGYAGYLADTLNKRGVLILVKGFEIVFALLAFAALLWERVDLLITALFFMGAQSTFFSPAKYGILPEAFAPRHLPRANGMMEMTRILAIIFGTAAGGAALDAWGDRPAFVGMAFVAVALVGFLASLWIMPAAAPGPRQSFRPNPWGEIYGGVARLARNRLLGPVVAGTTFFDFLSTLTLLDVLLVAKEIMGLDDLNTSLLAVMMGLGLGAGALAAGRLLGRLAGTRLVSLGACGVGLALIALALSTQSYGCFVVFLLALGFFGSLYLIPLNTLLQRAAGRNEKGRLIATNNFMNMAGVLAASGVLWLLRDLLGVRADGILLLSGVSALVVGVAIAWVPRLLRFFSPSSLRC